MKAMRPGPHDGIWLEPTPVDEVGAPVRIPTRLSGADFDNLTRTPVVGVTNRFEGAEVAETTFAYRERRNVDVMVHLNGLTDAHRTDIRPALLDRIGDSDWYAVTYLLPTDGVWSYRFVARENIPHDVGTERSGWLGIHHDGRTDPLNNDRLRHPHGTSSSVYRGPEAPLRAEYEGLTVEEPSSVDRKNPPQSRFWQAAELADGSGLSLHFSPDGNLDAPLLVLFDAEQHLAMPVLEALSRYTHPVDAVTLESGTTEQRSEVLPDPDRTAARLKTTLNVLAERFSRSYRPQDVILSGASYGGLAAAGVAVHHPEIARKAIAQSGSYWYDPDCEPRRDDDAPGALTRYLQGHTRLPNRQIIVQVGTDEGSMALQAQMFTTAATAAGIDVRARQYRGGHDWAWWSHALFDGLDDLFYF